MKFNAKRLLSLFLTTLIAFSTLGNVAAEGLKTDLNTSVSSDVVLNESNIAQDKTDSSLPVVGDPSSDVQSSPSVVQKPSSDVQSSSSIAQDVSSVSSSQVVAPSSQSVPESSSSTASSLPTSDITSSSVPNSASSSNSLDLPKAMQAPKMSIEDRIAAVPTMEEMAQDAKADGTMGTDNRSKTQVTPFASRQRGTTLNLKNIVVFMRFKDQTEFISPSAVDTLNKVYNNISDPTVSLNEYVNSISYKKLSVESQFYPQDSSNQVISVEVNQPIGYFLRYDATKNTIGYKNDNEYNSRESELIKYAFEAVNAQNPGAFSEGVDVHGAAGGGADSFIDSVTFAYLPENLPVKIEWADLLWPHKTSFEANAPSAGGVTLRDYNLLNAASLLDVNNFSSVTIIHEFFHTLGMPDLYRYSDIGNPIVYYDIMGENSLASPQSLLQYNIRNYMGFAPELQQITSTQKGVTLKAAQYADANEKSAVIVKSPINANEFFVVEMKNQTSFDSSMPNAKGLLVYRVNPSVKQGNMNGPPDLEYVSRANDVSNTSATGDNKLATLNLPSQLAPGEKPHRSAVGKAIDSANTAFDNETLFYADGTNSGVIIDNLSVSPDGSSMTFDVTVPSDSGVEDLNGWVTKDGEKFYNVDGNKAKGWLNINSQWYFFNLDTGVYFEGPGWVTVGSGKYYVNDNGIAQLGLSQIDGKWYFFNNSFKTGWQTINNKQYYFGTDGVALTGKQKIGNSWYYFTQQGEAMTGWVTLENGDKIYLKGINEQAYGWENINNNWYFFDLNTGVYFNGPGWINVGHSKYYVNNNGIAQLGLSQIEGKWYFLNNAIKTGWQTIENEQYYFNQDGTAANGRQKIGEKWYEFSIQGKVTNGWKIVSENEKYYFNQKGEQAFGWEQIGNDWYFFDPKTGVYFDGPGWVTVGACKYYVNDSGIAQLGLSQIGEKWYFLNTSIKTGWQNLNNEHYYFGVDGAALIGRQTIDGKVYYFNEQGKAITGWVTLDNGDKIYFGQFDRQAIGWEKIGEDWYFFDLKTGVYFDGPGWVTVGPCKYYVNDNGIAQLGLSQIESKWYYLNTSVKTGWQTINNEHYYFGADGVALSGKQRIDGKVYYFNVQGKAINGWITLDNKDKIYFGEFDRQAFGWEQIGYDWYFFDVRSGIYYSGPGWVTVGSCKYYVNDKGIAQLGLSKIDDKWYFLNTSIKTGWQTINNEKHYFGADGAALSGKQRIDGEVYYLDEQGKAIKGWITLENGDKIYYSEFDKQAFGWEKIGDDWYFFDVRSGVYYKGPGWVNVNSFKYYVNDKGVAQIGLSKIDNKWYFLNTSMKIGWQTINNALYYFGTDGAALSGRQKIGDKWYEFSDQGKATVGWKTVSENEKYYFNQKGEQAFGWEQIDNLWYFFDVKTGVYFKGPGWVNVNNLRYYVNDKGVAQIGLSKIEDKWYFLNTSMKIGWQTINNELYYFCDEGYSLPGRQKLGDKWYEFSDQGKATVGWKTVSENEKYYFNQKGEQAYGWEQIGGYWYLFDLDTGIYFKGPGWKKVYNSLYYVNDKGVAQIGLSQINGKWYYLNNSLKYGWITDNEGIIRYSDPSTGVIKINEWSVIDNKNCYFDTSARYVAPPTINNVLYTESGTDGIVKITATPSKYTYLHATAFSWDGGRTWTNESSRAYKLGTTIPANTIQVRDAVGNITVYGNEVVLKSNGPFYGIDVSAHQGDIDWTAVKASGVNFAIIRALTWSQSVGYYVIDPYFEYNVRQAKNNGIQVGAYLFSYAFSTNEIYEEVNFFYNSPEMQRLRNSNIKFDFPVYIDFEWDKILDNTSYAQRTEMVRSGMIRLEQLGFYPGFYSNHNWAEQYYDAKSLMAQGYDFWYARYPANPNLTAGPKQYGYDAEIWQYASDGRVNGINGNVDMNICYVDYKKIINAGGSSSGGDAQRTLSVYDLNSNKPVTGSVEDILSQIVMNEVGSWSNAPEVLKAQAVAAHSWVLYQQQHGDPIPKVGLATPNAAVIAAVNAVKGQTLFYGDSVINAAYGSASASMTNSASNMWGLDLPYLNNQVYSPETAYRGRSSTLSYQTVRNAVVKLVGEGAANANAPTNWITSPSYDSYGYLKSISVCGQSIGGGKFYENFWGLISPNFSISYNGNNTWNVSTNGNGHCVGMSQYGAYTFATASGSNYQQILAHYYPGSTLK